MCFSDSTTYAPKYCGSVSVMLLVFSAPKAIKRKPEQNDSLKVVLTKCQRMIKNLVQPLW